MIVVLFFLGLCFPECILVHMYTCCIGIMTYSLTLQLALYAVCLYPQPSVEMFSALVEEIRIYTRDLGKTTLPDLATLAIPHADTGNQTQEARV